MDRILPFFDHPPCVDSFCTLSMDKNRHFLTPSPLHLVHVVIECPLKSTLVKISKFYHNILVTAVQWGQDDFTSYNLSMNFKFTNFRIIKCPQFWFSIVHDGFNYDFNFWTHCALVRVEMTLLENIYSRSCSQGVTQKWRIKILFSIFS